MTTSPVGTITKNLVIATAPFNFSVPAAGSVNGTWYGEVMNVTVVPVNVGPRVSSGVSSSVGAGTGTPETKKASAASIRTGRGIYGTVRVVLSGLSLSLFVVLF